MEFSSPLKEFHGRWVSEQECKDRLPLGFLLIKFTTLNYVSRKAEKQDGENIYEKLNASVSNKNS